MRQSNPPSTSAAPHAASGAGRCRRDGWTAARQLAFLEILARTRSVTAAARAAGMSRESAYRLRARDPHSLFAVAWDRAMPPRVAPPTRAEVDQGHRRAIAAACAPQYVALPRRAQHCQNRDLSRAPEPEGGRL